MDNDYTFDAVSNILSVAINASLPYSGNAGGKTSPKIIHTSVSKTNPANMRHNIPTATRDTPSLAATNRPHLPQNRHGLKQNKKHLRKIASAFISSGPDRAWTYDLQIMSLLL